jgi:hypothetical protein
MKKRIFASLLLVGAAGIFILLSLAGQSGISTIFGPDFFIRGEGKPFIETREFSAVGFQAPFLFHLRNGDEKGNNRVSSASVWLNDKQLFSPNNFSKKVSGYDIPVELKEQNVLKVKLASAPGSKLKIWIEGIPITVIPEFVLDEEHSVSAFITNEEGGRIETWGANGVNYILDIPPDSLLQLEGKTITLAPILSAVGLPLNSPFVAGARLMPDGLELYRFAKLTIKLPAITNVEDIWGICFNGPLGEYYTYPLVTLDQATSTILFELRHFSDWVAFINGSCPGANPKYQQDIYKSALACLCRSSEPDWNQINSLFADWFAECIMPELYQATDLESFKKAFGLYLEWLRMLDQLGLEEGFGSQRSQAEARILVLLKGEVSRLETNCVQSTDWCVKEKLFKEFLIWLKVAEQTFRPELLGDLPTYDFCDYASRAVGKIEIGASRDLVPVDGTVEFLAVVTGINKNPVQIDNPPVTWSSSDESIAIIDQVYFDQGIPRAIIKGIAPGEVTITVKAENGCDKKASKTITVVESLWRVTWSAAFSDQYECTIPVPGPLTASKEGVWTIEGLLQGEATISTKGGFGQGVVSAFSSVSFRQYYVGTGTATCSGGGSGWSRNTELFTYHSTNTSELWKNSIWIIVDPYNARCQLAAPPTWTVAETTSEGVGCGGVVYPLTVVHSEGAGSGLNGFYFPNTNTLIPAEDDTHNSYHLMYQNYTGLTMGFNDLWNICPFKGVMATWDLRIERIR